MEKIAAITAVFVSCRQVRDEVHLIFAMPAEKATESLDRIGGFPKPGESRWCAIALLNSGANEIVAPDGGEAMSATNPPPPPADIASESGISRPPTYLSQQAAICCTKPHFRLFLEEKYSNMMPTRSRLGHAHINNEEEAADIVRFLCDVKSRSEIVPGSVAGERWEKLHGQFIAWEQCR